LADVAELQLEFLRRGARRERAEGHAEAERRPQRAAQLCAARGRLPGRMAAGGGMDVRGLLHRLLLVVVVVRLVHAAAGSRRGTFGAEAARLSIAACTPPLRCGTPASPSAISTPASVPASVRSLKSPRCPIRNTRPATLLSPWPSDRLKFS